MMRTQFRRFEWIKDIITKTRDIRNKHSIKNAEKLNFAYQISKTSNRLFSHPGVTATIIKRCGLVEVKGVKVKPDNGISFISDTDSFFVIVEQEIDIESEHSRLMDELNYAKGFVNSVRVKLNNDRFVQNAPSSVVDNERKKLKDGEERVRIIQESLKGLQV